MGRYKIKTVSALTKFSPELLRAWESRHHLLEPERTEGGHRLYTDDDVRVLRAIQRRLDEGRSIGEIAALGRANLLATNGLMPDTADDPAAGTADARLDLTNQIVQAAQNIDAGACRRAVDEALARWSVSVVVHSIFTPALVQIGTRWEQGQCSVAGEHLVSALLLDRLRRLIDHSNTSDADAPLALCACLPGEDHEFGISVVALQLARSGHRVSLLGRDLPLADLDLAIRRLSPSRVLLSAVRHENFLAVRDPLFKLLRRRKGQTTFVLGGPGIPRADHSRLEAAGAQVWNPTLNDQPLALPR